MPLRDGTGCLAAAGGEEKEGEKSKGNPRFRGLYTREGKGYPNGSSGLSLCCYIFRMQPI